MSRQIIETDDPYRAGFVFPVNLHFKPPGPAQAHGIAIRITLEPLELVAGKVPYIGDEGALYQHVDRAGKFPYHIRRNLAIPPGRTCPIQLFQILIDEIDFQTSPLTISIVSVLYLVNTY